MDFPDVDPKVEETAFTMAGVFELICGPPDDPSVPPDSLGIPKNLGEATGMDGDMLRGFFSKYAAQNIADEDSEHPLEARMATACGMSFAMGVALMIAKQGSGSIMEEDIYHCGEVHFQRSIEASL